MMAPTREQIVEQARTYLGVRWRHMGRDRSGVDCIGLIMAVATDLGYEVPSTGNYIRTPDTIKFMATFEAETDRGDITRLRPGSIVLLRQNLFPCHCGIIAFSGGQPHLIHAALKNRTVTEEPLTPFMHNITGVREYKGVK